MKPIILTQAELRGHLDKGDTGTIRRPVRGLAARGLELGLFTPEYAALPDNGYSPFGYVGDRLWVREAWCVVPAGTLHSGQDEEVTYYRSIWHESDTARTGFRPKWRPSIHMPRARSRVELEVIELFIDCRRDPDWRPVAGWDWVLEVLDVERTR